VTYGSYHRAMLPSVTTATARWHPKATAQDGSNPWKRILGIVMGLKVPWRQRFNQEEVDGLYWRWVKCRCSELFTENRCPGTEKGSARSCFLFVMNTPLMMCQILCLEMLQHIGAVCVQCNLIDCLYRKKKSHINFSPYV